MTEAEALLWTRLRRRQLCGARFRRQQPIGVFIADFACMERKLIIELDGGGHGTLHDIERDAWLKSRGYEVLRFWNKDVFGNLDGVLEAIASALQSPPSDR